MKIIGPLTTTKQSYDGRRTLNNRGLILFVLLVVLTFGLAPIDRSIARIFGALLFFLLIGGGVLGAGLTARDFRSHRKERSITPSYDNERAPLDGVHPPLSSTETPGGASRPHHPKPPYYHVG